MVYPVVVVIVIGDNFESFLGVLQIPYENKPAFSQHERHSGRQQRVVHQCCRNAFAVAVQL